MTAEEREDLLSNAPLTTIEALRKVCAGGVHWAVCPDEVGFIPLGCACHLADQIESERAKYETLASAFAKQERTMKLAAKFLRDSWGEPEWVRQAWEWADMLDEREPVAEADAAEKFSRECAEMKLK